MYPTIASGLPDPDFQAEFYEDVPSKRLIAWVIDTVLTAVICLVIAALTFPISLFFLPLWFVVVGFIYRATTIARWSATPGMRLMAIELRLGDGSRFDLPAALMHTTLFTVSASFFLPQVISIIMALNNPRGQMLHDLFMGSSAINRAARS